MNYIQIALHRGEKLSDGDKKYLRNLLSDSSVLVVLGAKILLGEHESAIELLKTLVRDGTISAHMFHIWPIFRLLPVDMSEDGQIVETERDIG